VCTPEAVVTAELCRKLLYAQRISTSQLRPEGPRFDPPIGMSSLLEGDIPMRKAIAFLLSRRFRPGHGPMLG
jgi:hypothetical protein